MKRQWGIASVGAVAALSAWCVLGTRDLAAQTEMMSVTPQPMPGAVARPAPTAPPSQSAIATVRLAIASADARDWKAIRMLRSQTTDPLVRKLLAWRIASDQDALASFEEIRSSLAETPGWPGRDTMRRRAEQAILDSTLSPAERIAWFEAGGPATGDGKIALAKAYRDQGRVREATNIVRDAWRTNTLTPRAASIARGELSGLLTTPDHAARVALLLWRDERSEAQSLMSLIPADDRAVAQARIALQTRPKRGLQAAVDNASAIRPNDAGLLFDRARYLRKSDRPEEALDVIARIKAADAPEGVRETLFKERRLYFSRMLRSGQSRVAYNSTADHGLRSGEFFADSEWMAGWVALRFTKDYAAAEKHFARLGESVGTPVSKARAYYWRALALKSLGRREEAQAQLAEGAKLNFTYYGQLSAAGLEAKPVMSLGDPPVITAEMRSAFESREIVRVLRLMAQAGDRQDFESIAFFLDDQLDTPAEHELLSELARQSAYTRTAVRSAKAGLRRGIVAPKAAYPLLDIPSAAREPGRPEPALINAITRQESEFDTQAVSGAGARGLMQLMPATAQLTARQYGLPYQREWLLDDPSYNVTLGAAYLGSLIDSWNGSYVLAIASYNAGPNRVREWIGDWGDPRNRGVDVVDWIELIPFSETRNYVQRVMENVEIYRHRLAGTPTPLEIDRDLRRGAWN